jgi:hypothetical protein
MAVPQPVECDYWMWSFRDANDDDWHTKCTRIIGVTGNPPQCPAHRRRRINPQPAPLHVRRGGPGPSGGGGGGGAPGGGAMATAAAVCASFKDESCFAEAAEYLRRQYEHIECTAWYNGENQVPAVFYIITPHRASSSYVSSIDENRLHEVDVELMRRISTFIGFIIPVYTQARNSD